MSKHLTKQVRTLTVTKSKHLASKVLAIDFDGVIHDYLNPLPGKRMGLPMAGAVAAMDKLYDARYKLIVFTVKATTKSGKRAVEDWLDYYGIEYHEVTAIKPAADFYIDDKAIRHTSWADTFKQLDFNPDGDDDV